MGLFFKKKKVLTPKEKKEILKLTVELKKSWAVKDIKRVKEIKKKIAKITGA